MKVRRRTAVVLTLGLLVLGAAAWLVAERGLDAARTLIERQVADRLGVDVVIRGDLDRWRAGASTSARCSAAGRP